MGRWQIVMQHELAQNWGIKTPDEDFGILLEAAVMYDRRVAALLHEEDSTGQEILSNGNEVLYPRLLFIITGSADLGVCLHTSSSGLDLPMKMLVKGFPDECNALNSLKNGALEMGSSARWATELEENSKPVISEVSAQL
ncbi:hypothetical protein Acr_23g0006520 [Actinidia rufa]|uniref:Uncharacterized protein n=1 Tax=Actinidia rufa TaxID=165716 RepID=A0A7J0GN86_9ERIC|nr:hypothetical protein Acr_23g0006520 [Actinidia rufa]